MGTIKAYILIAILPAVVVWLFFFYLQKIKNPAIRRAMTPLLIAIGLGGGVIAIQQIGTVFQRFSLENVLEEANKTQWWISYSTERDNGTGYSLGEIDPSLGGLIRVFPRAVNVALFRPYIWEARKPIVLPSAMEAIFALLLTLYAIWKAGILGFFRGIFKDPAIPFCLVFSIFFAFAVGFTSMNFGALARYKIPCLPFYFVAMMLLIEQGKQKKITQTEKA